MTTDEHRSALSNSRRVRVVTNFLGVYLWSSVFIGGSFWRALVFAVVGLASSAAALERPLTGGQSARFHGGETPRTAIRFAGDAALSAVGDPQCPTASSLRLLLWDEAVKPIALDCRKWRRTATGYRYVDPSAAAGGVRKIVLSGQRLAVYLNGNTAAANAAPPFAEVTLTIGADGYCGRFAAPRRRSSNTLAASGPTQACQLPRPNIVLVVLDDVRRDGIDRMPNLLNRIAAEGVSFDNAFTPNASCAPSRASILTGQYALRHRVDQVAGPVGGADRFRQFARDRQTIGVWLRNAGYRTGMFGKYINDYSVTEQDKGPNGTFYVPPGWDRWWVFVSPEHYGGIRGTPYQIVDESGGLTDYSDTSSDAEYSTDLSAKQVRAFIADAAQRGQPFFAYWAPYAAHGETPNLVPAPAERHANVLRDIAPWRPEAWNEQDVTDKPRWIQHGVEINHRPVVVEGQGKRVRGALAQSIADEFRQRQYESLLAADEQIGALLDQLVELGIDDQTLIIVISDNGFSWGEHQVWSEKGCAYDECQRVPLIARYPRRIAPGRHTAGTALNLDIAPTLAAIAGAPVSVPEDGADLSGWLFEPAPANWRSDYLLEHWRMNQSDSLHYTGQVADGDRLRVLYGDMLQKPRLSHVFEFESRGGVSPGAIAVPIGKTADESFVNLAQAMREKLKSVRVDIDTKRHVLAAMRPSQNEFWTVYFWEEVDQKNSIEPQDEEPGYFGVRDVDGGYLWVEYETGEHELYDMNVDPNQLDNRADDPAYASVRERLERRLDELIKTIRSR
jgi:N-acetylglucosamine-6-sulfatase